MKPKRGIKVNHSLLFFIVCLVIALAFVISSTSIPNKPNPKIIYIIKYQEISMNCFNFEKISNYSGPITYDQDTQLCSRNEGQDWEKCSELFGWKITKKENCE